MQTSSLECVTKTLFSYFSTKTYVMGAQKNHPNETVLLSIKTYVKKQMVKKN